MQVDGARALVDGVNPYLPIYENIHGADTTYYGPGLVVNGELTIGFPYPPLSLLLVLPGELLAGDVRYAHLVAIELSALVMAATRPGTVATKAALLWLFTPWTFLMAVGGWTEPLVVLLLAIVVLAAVRAPRVLGVALGLLIVVKQSALLGLPLALLLLARDGRARWRIGWQSVAVAAAVTLPFVLWDIGAFSWSTLGSIAGQVFRPDTLTYLAVLPGDWGPRLSVVGSLVLLPAAALVAWRAPRTPSGFAASFGFMLIAFFAFSRQGGGNYYFAAIGALCCAVAASQWQPSQPGNGMSGTRPMTWRAPVRCRQREGGYPLRRWWGPPVGRADPVRRPQAVLRTATGGLTWSEALCDADEKPRALHTNLTWRSWFSRCPRH